MFTSPSPQGTQTRHLHWACDGSSLSCSQCHDDNYLWANGAYRELASLWRPLITALFTTSPDNCPRLLETGRLCHSKTRIHKEGNYIKLKNRLREQLLCLKWLGRTLMNWSVVRSSTSSLSGLSSASRPALASCISRKCEAPRSSSPNRAQERLEGSPMFPRCLLCRALVKQRHAAS